MNKYLFKNIVFITAMFALTSCGSDSTFDSKREITVVSREDGSGTRGAFVEMFDILEKTEDGEIDRTYEEAIITSKTDVVMTTVASDIYGVGYISLGSMNESLTAVSVDGVDATTENVMNGSYTVSRPFLMVTKNDNNDKLTQDVINFVVSKQGQEIVGKQYVIANVDAEEYKSSGLSGKLTIGGSTSVAPIMEKLVEEYIEINPNVTIDIQATGSSAGITGVIDGSIDIGMSSRDLKEDEKPTLTETVMALDGLAVVVNHNNPIKDLSSEDIKKIFIGEVTTWEEVYE